jgi:hypothetical protein
MWRRPSGFYNNRLHLGAEYMLWDEPDLAMFWKGTTEQGHFLLYRATMLGDANELIPERDTEFASAYMPSR